MTRYKQMQQAQIRAQANATTWAVATLLKAINWQNPQLNDIWCSTLNNVARKHADDFWADVAGLSIDRTLS